MNDKTISYIKAWILKADNDLKNAELVIAASESNLPYDTVCFHCQQTVEKYLKAFLIYSDIAFPLSHNLADLVELCIQVESSFSDYQRRAETLTPYAVEIRYPDDLYMPTNEEAVEALTIARQIKDFVLSRMDID